MKNNLRKGFVKALFLLIKKILKKYKIIVDIRKIEVYNNANPTKQIGIEEKEEKEKDIMTNIIGRCIKSDRMCKLKNWSHNVMCDSTNNI